MKKILFLLTMALFLVNCKGDDSNAEPTPPQNSGNEQTTPTTPQDPAEQPKDEKVHNLPLSPKAVTTGTLYRTTISDPEFGSKVTLDIWTPKGYNLQEKYPVVYMHDGQNLYDKKSSWNKQAWEIDEVGGRLIAEGTIKPFIAVGIHSIDNSRICDLMPQKILTEYFDTEKYSTTGFESYCNKEIRGDKYINMIVNTIKPYIDSIFSTLPDRDNTAIMGSSMGGLISFYGMCEKSDVFGTAVCLSTHLSVSGEEGWAEAVFAYLRDKLPTDGVHRIYFDCGDKTSDKYYVPFYNEMIKIPAEMGYSEANFAHGFYPGAAHEEKSWAARVHVPLTFLYGK